MSAYLNRRAVAYVAWLALLIVLGMASGVAVTLVSRQWDGVATVAAVLALVGVYVACHDYDRLSDWLAWLRWRWHWRWYRRWVHDGWRSAYRWQRAMKEEAA